MKNFGDIQKLAQKMQADMAKAQEELGAMTVEGSAGGGAVVVVMTGTQECKEVRIKKEAVDPEDVETLEDLVRAATADALTKSKQLAFHPLSPGTFIVNLPRFRGHSRSREKCGRSSPWPNESGARSRGSSRRRRCGGCGTAERRSA